MRPTKVPAKHRHKKLALATTIAETQEFRRENLEDDERGAVKDSLNNMPGQETLAERISPL